MADHFQTVWEAMLTRLRVGDPFDPGPGVFALWFAENMSTGISEEEYLENYRLRRPPFYWNERMMKSSYPDQWPPLASIAAVLPPALVPEETRSDWGVHPEQDLAADLFVTDEGLMFCIDRVGTLWPVPWASLHDIEFDPRPTPQTDRWNATVATMVDKDSNRYPFLIAYENGFGFKAISERLKRQS